MFKRMNTKDTHDQSKVETYHTS